ncbi:MAG: ABC transporter ATP-binding protein [Proteobacteria bacterium]|nr:ABC transporter ATP-binding protein [Pseudomonadota bacterium]
MLAVTNLNVAYGATQVLEDVTFAVEEKRIVALLGGNGSGKTTVLNSLVGLVRPKAGRIEFEGRSCVGLSTADLVKRGIVQVPQGRELFQSMTVLENLELGAVTRRDWKAIRTDLEEVYALFPRLEAKARMRSGQLSGGEQQMVAIGRALMARPRILLMDEPSVGLSPAVVGDMIDAVRTLHTRGLTFLLVEQNVGVAAALADYAHILQGGRIAYSGPAEGLLDSEDVLRTYLG